MSSLFDIGVNSLMATHQALSVTSQNIANANTPGYSRRVVDFSEAFYGFSGNGVRLSNIRRMSDQMANQALLFSSAQYAKSEVQAHAHERLETLLEDSNSGILSYLRESSQALNAATANPTSVQARETYLNQMQQLTYRFNTLGAEINREQNIVSDSLRSGTTQANQILQSVAQINTKIINSSGQQKSALLDERDKLLSSLSEFLSFETTANEQDGISIQLSNGLSLLSNGEVGTLSVHPSSDRPGQSEIRLQMGQMDIELTQFIHSGELGGLLAYQDGILSTSRNTLGRLALGISDSLNEQHHLGIDLNGRLGQDLLQDINRADAMIQRVIAHKDNQGDGTVSVAITEVSDLTASDYRLEFETADDYRLIRLSDMQVVATGDVTALPEEINVDGFQVRVTAANFSAGDKLIISPTRHAATDMKMQITDPRQLALALPITASASLQNIGHASIGEVSVVNTDTPDFATEKALSPPIRIEFTSPTTYQLVNANDDSIIEAALPYDPNGTNLFPTAGAYDPGYRISLNGHAQTGDTFNIEYNIDGMGDNRNGLLIANLSEQSLLENHSYNFSQAFHAINNNVSNQTYSAKITHEGNRIIKNQAEARRDHISGVSLEEESMNLARFQQAFQANAQIMTAIQTVFETLMGIGRR